MEKMDPNNFKKMLAQKGFTIVELLVVVIVLAILGAIAIPQMRGLGKTTAEDQARKMIDLFDEARQKALNQRRTFRVEINKTKNELRLIDEGVDASTASDDKILKKLPLSPQVIVGVTPSNVNDQPPATSPISAPAYATTNYPLSSGEEKITLRFKRNGQVVDTGTDNIGTGSMIKGALIFVYPRPTGGQNPDTIRAATVLGTTGDTSLYKCKVVLANCTNWYR